MGFLDRLLGRPKRQPASDPSTTTIAAVNQSYANPGYRKYFSDREPRRKAIASVSRWQSTYGIQRPDYSPAEIDRLAENVIYAMCEKRCMDYASTAEWTVEDGEGNEVGPAIQFLSKPNPQDTFSSLLVATIPDIMRGDCGCWVKTFNGLDKLAELRAYNGDEFWPEVDRGFSPVEGLRGEATYGVYSHGYIVRWWQHSAPGIYVPYDPAEIVYIRMYPRSDSPFGTSLLQRVKWQLEYLIDSTAAAGMTFANGVMPGLEWNHANLQGPEQLAEMIVDREERYVGVQNAGGIIDTFEGDTLKPLTPSMVDMQWLDGQKLVSETVWAYFGFPASEFLMGDTNRATAYIARNIVKSSVLAPMLSRLEGYINGCVLPDLEGYQPDWTFKFIESVDKDDELKDVQVLQGRQQIAMGYYQMGMPLLMCLRLAGLPEEDIEAVKQEEIDAPDIDSDLPGSTHAATQTDDGPVTEQYTGTDATQAHEGSGENDGDGTGSTSPRISAAAVCPNCGHEWYSKATGDEITCPQCGRDFQRTMAAGSGGQIRKADNLSREHWITMNGAHVLVKDGEVVGNSEVKKKLGKIKVYAGKTNNEKTVFRARHEGTRSKAAENSHFADYDIEGDRIDQGGDWSTTPTPEELFDWDARAKEASRVSKEVGIDLAKPLYIRYGRIPKGGQSLNHATREKEGGVSAYHGSFDPETGLFDISEENGLTGASLAFERAGKTPYLIQGEEIGTGADGEPLLKDAVATHKLRVTSEGMQIETHLLRKKRS